MAKRFNNNNNNNQRNEKRFRTNNSIKVPKLRLVGEDFDAISEAAGRPVENGVYNTNQAQKWADEMGLDLVE